MRFITESELRSAYKARPFSSYHLDTAMRLTPEAKQFLMDFRINILSPASELKKTAVQASSLQDVKRLQAHLHRLEAQMLVQACALQEKAPLYAREVQKMARLLKTMRLHPEALQAVHDQKKQTMPCMEATEAHLMHPRGDLLLLLQLLFCELEVFCLALAQFTTAFQILEVEQQVYESYLHQMMRVCQEMMAECDGGVS